jgi:hypothetical protein
MKQLPITSEPINVLSLNVSLDYLPIFATSLPSLIGNFNFFNEMLDDSPKNKICCSAASSSAISVYDDPRSIKCRFVTSRPCEINWPFLNFSIFFALPVRHSNASSNVSVFSFVHVQPVAIKRITAVTKFNFAILE